MDGIYVASMVLFDDEGKINKEETKKLLERNLSEGAAGFFVAGSSGECFLMDRKERVQLYEQVAEYKDKADLFAHVGALSTQVAIFYAKEAKQMGYKKIAATPPFYFGYSTKELARYYYDISEAIDMPIYYYNIPINTFKQVQVDDEETAKLFKSGTIAGIKHTNLDLYEMDRIKSLNSDIKVYGGFENEMVGFMAMGCDGFIGSTFNFMLPHYKKIYDLFLSGNIEEARNLQIKANNSMQALNKVGLFPGIKHMLTVQGINAGHMRRPFLPLSEDKGKYLENVVKDNLVLE